jgi:hypothetical protein
MLTHSVLTFKICYNPIGSTDHTDQILSWKWPINNIKLIFKVLKDVWNKQCLYHDNFWQRENMNTDCCFWPVTLTMSYSKCRSFTKSIFTAYEKIMHCLCWALDGNKKKIFTKSRTLNWDFTHHTAWSYNTEAHNTNLHGCENQKTFDRQCIFICEWRVKELYIIAISPQY